MQFLIDTATDAPAELYRIGKFLTDNYAVADPEPREARPVDYGSILKDAEPSPTPVYTAPPPSDFPPAPPPPPVPGNTADDVEIETDDAGTVTSLTTSVTLPPPPPVPAPPGPAAAPELDSKGMPWDGRIHAANRSKTIKGEWKAKRGVSADLVTAVEASNGPAAVPSVPRTDSVPEPVAQTAPPTAVAPPPPPAPPVSVQLPDGAPSVPTGAPAQPLDFLGLMKKISAATKEGKITLEQVNSVLASFGLQPTEMQALVGNGPLIASVNAGIDSCMTR